MGTPLQQQCIAAHRLMPGIVRFVERRIVGSAGTEVDEDARQRLYHGGVVPVAGPELVDEVGDDARRGRGLASRRVRRSRRNAVRVRGRHGSRLSGEKTQAVLAGLGCDRGTRRVDGR